MPEHAPNRTALILRKEWIEIRQQKAVLFGTVLPPLLFSILPLVIVFVFGLFPPDEDTKELAESIAKVNPAFEGMNLLEAGQALIGQQIGLMFLLLPTILTSIIASYSIVGEKTNRTLEPVLATPVSTSELLVAKSLSALIPAVLATWFAALVFIVGLPFVAISPRVFEAVVSPGWILSVLLITPLLGMITVALTVAVSSRTNDPRTAQQISIVLIVPIMMLFVGQLLGLLALSPFVVLMTALVLGAFATFTIWLAVRVFQREAILTRWT